MGKGDLNTVPWCIGNCSKPLELQAPRTVFLIIQVQP